MFYSSPQFSNAQVHVFRLCISLNLFLHFDVLKECFLQQNGNYSGTVERLRHYSGTVLFSSVINVLTAHCLVFAILFLMAFAFEFKIN